jgi:hypothetical protein
MHRRLEKPHLALQIQIAVLWTDYPSWTWPMTAAHEARGLNLAHTDVLSLKHFVLRKKKKLMA